MAAMSPGRMSIRSERRILVDEGVRVRTLQERVKEPGVALRVEALPGGDVERVVGRGVHASTSTAVPIRVPAGAAARAARTPSARARFDDMARPQRERRVTEPGRMGAELVAQEHEDPWFVEHHPGPDPVTQRPDDGLRVLGELADHRRSPQPPRSWIHVGRSQWYRVGQGSMPFASSSSTSRR